LGLLPRGHGGPRVLRYLSDRYSRFDPFSKRRLAVLYIRGSPLACTQYRFGFLGNKRISAGFNGVAFAVPAKGSPCTVCYVVSNKRPSEATYLAMLFDRSNLSPC
jgi:hypothetical protein